MEDVLRLERFTAEQNRRISEALEREGARLRSFIRRRVPTDGDAEDIFQEVFYELIEAYRLLKPVEQVGAWLFRVARNRIIDLFRRRKPEPLASAVGDRGGDEPPLLEDLLPSSDAGPDVEYARGVLIDELEAALNELPPEQREAFVAHEIEGRTFEEIAKKTGINRSTLVSRKRYALLFLRRRLAAIHEEFTTN